MKKTIIILLLITIAVLVSVTYHFAGGLFLGDFFNLPIGRNVIENDFRAHNTTIVTVKDYLISFEHETAYITNTSDKGLIFAGIEIGDVLIEDEEAVDAINLLFKEGYSVIEKSNGVICFQRWSNLDNGRGLAYSIDGSEPQLQFLTKLEYLGELNWYYYEEDYNEWRIRNVK